MKSIYAHPDTTNIVEGEYPQSTARSAVTEATRAVDTPPTDVWGNELRPALNTGWAATVARRIRAMENNPEWAAMPHTVY